MLVHEVIFQGQPERAALSAKGQITYRQLQRWVNAYRDFFYEQGIRPGDYVGLIAKNSPEFVYSYMAASSLGAVIVPINFQLVPREIAYIVQDAKIKTIITAWPIDLNAALLERGYQTEVVQLVIPDFAAILHDKDFSSAPSVNIAETDVSVILYTSGTTGNPKGAVLTHRNIVSNAKSFSPIIALDETAKALCVLPMYHSFAWTCTIVASLLNGSCVTILESFIPKDTITLIRDAKITHVYGVPPMFSLFSTLASPADFESVRYIVSGGSALPQKIGEQFKAALGKDVLQGYGLTEASPVVAVNPPGKIKHCSIGIPIPGVEIRIVDPSGQPLPVGEIGELTVRGSNVMQGYLNLPLETAQTVRSGWLHTGDVAYRDPDGYFFIVDRLKDLIITSGENIYPQEIEEVLFMHPDIAEAAVIGIPDKLRVQSALAFIVTKNNVPINKKQLKEYLQPKLAAFKIPRDFVQVESLPKNATGKVLKNVLRDKAEAALS